MEKRSVSPVARLKYWREEDAQVVVDSWRRSGDSFTAFARRHGVKVERLRRWAARLATIPETEAGEAAPATAPSFHPVRVVGPDVVSDGYALEIELTDGRCVRLKPAFDADDLRRVLAVLEER